MNEQPTQLQKEKDAQKMQLQEDIKHELRHLQNWGANPTESVQQYNSNVHEFQQSYDRESVQELSQSISRTEVSQGSSEDDPPVPAEALKESWKERRQRKKTAKLLQKEFRDDDLRIMRVRFDLPDDNIAEKITPLLTQKLHFDKQGNPADSVDQDVFARNKQNIRDYASGDPTLRKPLIDNAVNRYMNMKINICKLNDPKAVLNDMPYYRELMQLQSGLRTLLDDNPQYVSAMSHENRMLLEERLRVMDDAHLNDMIKHTCGMQGVDIDTGAMTSEDMRQYSAQQRAGCIKNFMETTWQYNVDVEAEVKHADLLEKDATRQAKMAKTYNVKFPNGADQAQYEEMQKWRHKIAEKPEIYGQNRALIDAAYNELYKSMASIGENSGMNYAYQERLNADKLAQSEGSGDGMEGLRTDCVLKSQKELEEQKTAYTKYAKGITDLLKSILNNAPATESAKRIRADLLSQINQAPAGNPNGQN